MKLERFVLGSLLPLAPAFASGGDTLAVSQSPAKGVPGVATPQQQGTAQALVGGSDACSTADPITGTGPFSFTTVSATTGTEGQFNTNCNFFGQIGIANDVWFAWTAPQTGGVKLTTVGQATNDTKIAVYNGATCPAPSAGGTAYACNDDQGAGTLQSSVFFDVVSGNQYLIQLGNFPGGAVGAATFTIEYRPTPGPTPCQWDDGTPEIILATGVAGAEACWLQRFGNVGDVTTVSAVSVSLGAAFFAATPNTFTNGTAIKVAIWDDPNDDGDPTDAVFLQSQPYSAVGVDTDVFNPYALSPAVTVNGVYFVGFSTVRPNPSPANWFPAAMDGNGPYYEPKRAWRTSNSSGTLNFANLALNSTPPGAYSDIAVTLANNDFNGVLLIRPDCAPFTVGTSFCAGDGVAPGVTTACPCSNFGGAGNGCASSFNSAGAHIDASGTHDATTDAVSFQGTGMNASGNCIFFKGNAEAVGGAVFGDGITCVGGTLVRFAASALTAGSASYPVGAQPLISVRGGTPPGSGIQAWYGAFYRNAAAAFCPPATFNCTNSYTITW